MAGPWENYQQPNQAATQGPWSKYSNTTTSPIQEAQQEQFPASTEPSGGVINAISNAFTGSDRMTPQMESLPPVGNAPELNSLTTDAARAGWAMIFGSDKSQNQILESMGGKISQDEKGNQIVTLPSGTYAVNKPGLSPQDVAGAVGQVAAFLPAARAGTIAKAGIGAAATETGLLGVTQAAGGEDIDPSKVLLSGVFGAAGKGIENAVGGVYRAIKGQAAPAQQAAVDFAESTGAPILTTDVLPPGTFAGRSAQAAAEKIPIAGTGAIRRGQQEQRSGLVEEFAKKYGDYNPSEIVDSLKSQTSKIKQAAGKRIEDISTKMSGVQISPTKALAQLDDEIKRLSDLGKVADTPTISKLQAYRDELASTNDFSMLQRLRSQFRQDVKGDRQVMPNQSDAAVNRAYAAMTNDINESLGRNLGSDVASRWKQANMIYASEAGKINNTRLKTILQKGELTPETVNTMLFSNKPSDIRNLYTSLNVTGKNAMRAGIVGKAWEMSGGSPDRFLSSINKLQGASGIVFKGQDKAYLDGLTNYLKYTQRAGRSGVVTPTGQEILQFGAPVAAISDIAGSGGVGTMSAGAYGALARMYESAPVRNALLKLKSIPKGSTAFEKQVAKVQQAITTATQTTTE